MGIPINNFDPANLVETFENFEKANPGDMETTDDNDGTIPLSEGVVFDGFKIMLRNFLGATPRANLRVGRIIGENDLLESDLETSERRLNLSVSGHAFLLKSIDSKSKTIVLIDPHRPEDVVEAEYHRVRANDDSDDYVIQLTGKKIKDHWRRFRRGRSTKLCCPGSIVTVGVII